MTETRTRCAVQRLQDRGCEHGHPRVGVEVEDQLQELHPEDEIACDAVPEQPFRLLVDMCLRVEVPLHGVLPLLAWSGSIVRGCSTTRDQVLRHTQQSCAAADLITDSTGRDLTLSHPRARVPRIPDGCRTHRRTTPERQCVAQVAATTRLLPRSARISESSKLPVLLCTTESD